MAKKAKGAKAAPKLDKATKKRVKAQLAGDPGWLMSRAARLVIFLTLAWSTLTGLASGTLEPGQAVARLIACAIFAALSVGFVRLIIEMYQGGAGRGDRPDNGDAGPGSLQ